MMAQPLTFLSRSCFKTLRNYRISGNHRWPWRIARCHVAVKRCPRGLLQTSVWAGLEANALLTSVLVNQLSVVIIDLARNSGLPDAFTSQDAYTYRISRETMNAPNFPHECSAWPLDIIGPSTRSTFRRSIEGVANSARCNNVLAQRRRAWRTR